MNYTTILKKGKGLFSWVYKNIINKFTGMYSKLKEWFPVLNRYPLLKYSLIPLLITLFLLLRYVLKFVIDEIAASTSNFVGETSGYTIPENVIVLSIAAVFIILRIVLRYRNQKKEKWLSKWRCLASS